MPGQLAGHEPENRAWPFLIGRTRNDGQRIVLMPDFMTDPDAVTALRDATGPADLEYGTTVLRELRGLAVGPVLVAYKIITPRALDYGLGTEDMLTDKTGRPIRLTGGLVVRRPAGDASGARITQRDLDHALRISTTAYRQFWLEGSAFTRQLSDPFGIGAGGQDAEPLSAVELAPFVIEPSPSRDPSGWRAESWPPESRSPEQKRRYRLTPATVASAAAFAAALAGTVIIFLLHGSPAPTAGQTLTRFCAALRTGNVTAAYAETTTGFQHATSRSAFGHELLGAGNGKTITCTYKMTHASSATTRATLTLRTAADGSSAWHVTMVTRSGHGWLISHLTRRNPTR
jgi:hypothetical protein